jgi:hypothetical protein
MKWSISKAAVEFGSSRETISRGLRGNGVTVSIGKEFTTKQIFAALAGDLKFERTRRERAEAEKIERENRIAESELLDVAAVDKIMWTDCLQPLRVELMNLPAQLAPLCNPENPATAQTALDNHIAGILQKIKTSQPAETAPEK